MKGGPRFCIPNQLPGHTSAGSPGTTLFIARLCIVFVIQEPRTCSFNTESICLPTICKKQKKKKERKADLHTPSFAFSCLWNCLELLIRWEDNIKTLKYIYWCLWFIAKQKIYVHWKADPKPYRYACCVLWSHGWRNGKECVCQCWRCERWGFDPWVGKIPWRRKCQPIPVFSPGKSHGWRSLAGYIHGVTTSWTWLNTHTRCAWRIPHSIC